MARVRCPGDCAFISYLDLAQIPSRRVFGLHKFPAGGADGIGFWGLQACAFPRRTLEFLAAHDPYSIRTENKRRNGDRVVAQFLADSPWPQIAYHSPSLFRHVGEVSAAHADRIHPMPSVPLNYPGDQFDSLTLPAFTAGVLG